jgi:hypothetical protein
MPRSGVILPAMKLATKTRRHKGYNYYKKIFLVSLCLCGLGFFRLAPFSGTMIIENFIWFLMF